MQSLTEMLGVRTSFLEAVEPSHPHLSVVWHLSCSDRCSARLTKLAVVSDPDSSLGICLFALWQPLTQHPPVWCPTKCLAVVMQRWKDFQVSFKEKDVTNCLTGSQEVDPARWGSSHGRAAKRKGEDGWNWLENEEEQAAGQGRGESLHGLFPTAGRCLLFREVTCG